MDAYKFARVLMSAAARIHLSVALANIADERIEVETRIDRVTRVALGDDRLWIEMTPDQQEIFRRAVRDEFLQCLDASAVVAPFEVRR